MFPSVHYRVSNIIAYVIINYIAIYAVSSFIYLLSNLALVCFSFPGLRIQVSRVFICGEVPTALCSNFLAVFVYPRRCSYSFSCMVEVPLKLNIPSSLNMN